MSTVGFIFFLATTYQNRTSKIGITFFHISNSSYAFYKIKAFFKTLIQLNSIHTENYSKQQVSYFYQIVHFKMKLTKFGSLHLDTPSSRCDFWKIAFKI